MMAGRLVGVMRSRDLRYLALEAIVVIFGVLAALLVDRWREEAGQRRAAEAAVQRLYAEVGQNLRELEDMKDVVERRLGLLRLAAADAKDSVRMADLVGEFEGYRTPDLSAGAWRRLSDSDLADAVDPELLTEAFYLYEWNRQFEQLDGEINRLVYSELFYAPERRAIAVAISERIMAQQLTWARQSIPQYEAFLGRANDD